MFHHRLTSIWLIELRGKRQLHTLNPDFLWKKKIWRKMGCLLLNWVLLTNAVLLKLARRGCSGLQGGDSCTLSF